MVIQRSIDVGQTVAASLSAPLLFLIANDLTKMQVNANVDEADVGQISTSDSVSFTVDAYPNQTFDGRIKEVRLNAQNVQNVVTYSVIIAVDNSDLRLKPGMTANISMVAEHRENVVKVPNAALRFRPASVTPAEEARLVRGGRPGANGRPGPAGSERGRDAAGPRARGEGGMAARGERGRPSAAAPGHRAAGAGTISDVQVGPEPGPQELAPGQLWNPNDKIKFPVVESPEGRPALVWVVGNDGRPTPVRVVIGITDGSNTEVLSGDLNEGEKVITGDMSAGARRASGGRGGGFRFRF